MPESASEFASVFRRCAKAAFTTGRTAASDGPSTRSNATSADSTRGRGLNTVGATGWKPSLRVLSWTRTETAPYAFVRGEAKKRSATSRCTITHQSTSEGMPSRLSITSGVAML